MACFLFYKSIHNVAVGSCLHFSVTVPVASKTVYMTAIENRMRDYPCSGSLYNTPDSGGKCGVPYRTYFRMLVQDIWYSMAISPVHFTVISTEHDWSLTSKQIQYTMDSFHKVDLAVWGHVHNYERTCAVFQGHCLQHPIKDLVGVDFFDTRIYSAPVHAVVGMAEFSLDDFPRNLFIWY
ncbi:hypothetical protein SELMODRAFT_431545 [Selaginella moellendorffii]|uniref:Calcineurin-like phosphoesterase domain-containing protein n=1 Tax=Selaginella moellendorffii TaxID=88036 RepID=D8TD06_SELML|nr:hypothetical protein SELMODRAFT_431545 [Selaginella moellendorffii]